MRVVITDGMTFETSAFTNVPSPRVWAPGQRMMRGPFIRERKSLDKRSSTVRALRLGDPIQNNFKFGAFDPFRQCVKSR